MSDSKKYYWLRLHRDFFKRHDIKIIENMPNGKDYILFYLKLLVESIDHNGQLRFSETIPYNEDMLSTITDTNIDIVRSAMKIFSELKMVEMLEDSTIYMNEVSKMIGSSTQDEHTRESTRNRVREFRKRKQELTLEDKSLQKRYSNVTCNGEIEIDIDIYKEKEINKEKESCYIFDLDGTFEKLFSQYPKKRNHATARVNYLNLFKGVPDDRFEILSGFVDKGMKLFADDYKKHNPNDKSFNYIPTLDVWLKEDALYWIKQAEVEENDTE